MRKVLGRVAFTVLALALVLATVLAARMVVFRSRQPRVQPPAAMLDVDELAAAQRLATAVRFPTVSREGGATDPRPFTDLNAWLEASFPRTFAALGRERVERGQLLTWRGADPSLAPVLLVGHADVVPVEPGTEREWSRPPFGGEIGDGFVWGRGTLDDKSTVLGLLEAVERLLADGFRPRRTVLLAFGEDEEVGGEEGAAAIAALLAARGVRPAWALDEGMAIVDGMIPGLDRPLAAVGVAEKGFVTFDLTVETEGGHSSMPPPESAIGILAAALARLEAAPMALALDGPARQGFEFLSPEMPFGGRLAFANLWLFGPLVERELAARPAGAALLRTTIAPTLLEAGVKDNVLASRARAAVNARIQPRDSIAAVARHVRRAVADPRVRLTLRPGMRSEPSPVSPASGPGFQAVGRAVREVFPEAVVAPWLVLGATDGRHYAGVAGAVYRFAPLRLRPEDLARIHGTDERIAIAAYADMIRFYVRLLSASAA